MNKYYIYSDGSLKGSYLTKETKPQRGGYSAIICDENKNIIKEIYGGKLKSTSPRMELTGVLEGLR
jgi:ribonuclease HI